MGIFSTNSDLEDKLEQMKLKNQLLDEKLSTAQKKAMIKEIKKKYGKDWKNILKIGKDSDFMRQFAHAGRTMGDIGGSRNTEINASRYGFGKSSTPTPPSPASTNGEKTD